MQYRRYCALVSGQTSAFRRVWRSEVVTLARERGWDETSFTLRLEREPFWATIHVLFEGLREHAKPPSLVEEPQLLWIGAGAEVACRELPRHVLTEWPAQEPPPPAVWHAREGLPEAVWVGSDRKCWQIERPALQAGVMPDLRVTLAAEPPSTLPDLIAHLMDWAEHHMRYDTLMEWTEQHLGDLPTMAAQASALSRLLGSSG